MSFLIVAAALLMYLSVAFVFAWKIVHPNRQPLDRTPSDVGVDFEDVTFKSRDGIELKGWLLPGTGRGVIIQTHPNPFNRLGFNPRKQGFPPLYFTAVDLLASAKALRDAGYSVLCFDFRNHGTSGSGKTAVGLNEWQDVAGALDWVASVPGLRDRPLGFASYCMGANSTIIAADRDPAAFSRVSCVLAVQPISAEVFIKAYMKNMYTPLSMILFPTVNLMVRMLGSYPFKDMTPLPAAHALKCPVLFLQARKDPWTRLDHVDAIFRETGSTDKKLTVLDEPKRRFDTYNWVHEHPDLMLEFFNRHLSEVKSSV